MKIVVCVSSVSEVSAHVAFTADATAIDPAYVVSSVNEADTNAVEAALQLVAAAGDGEVVVVSAGDDTVEDALRAGLTMGAHRAVRVWRDGLELADPRVVAAALARVVDSEQPQLVMTGVQASDFGSQAVGPALAAVWGVPCVPVVTRVDASGPALSAVREFEGGITERVETDLPAVVTVQVASNTPRYGSFKDKMRAKKAEIPVLDPGDLPPARVRVRELAEVSGGPGRAVAMVDGGPAAVATEILDLVRKVQR